MVSVLRESIGLFQEVGFLNVLLPFLFIYAVVFAMLEKTKVFGLENGKPKRNLNSMAAFVLGFVFIASVSRVESLVLYLQILGMGLVFVLAILSMFAAFQQKAFFDKGNILYIFAFIFIIVAFFYTVGLWNNEKASFILDLIMNPVVIITVVFYLLIMFITGSNKSGRKSKADLSKIEPELEKRAKKYEID